MAHQKSELSLAGRPATGKRQSWHNEDFVNGELQDVTPQPGKTYTRDTWPPRGRGRGESLISPRRIEAKFRAARVIEMRIQHHTWAQIARALGFKDASGPYRAYKRVIDRLDWDNQRKQELERHGA